MLIWLHDAEQRTRNFRTTKGTNVHPRDSQTLDCLQQTRQMPKYKVVEIRNVAVQTPSEDVPYVRPVRLRSLHVCDWFSPSFSTIFSFSMVVAERCLFSWLTEDHLLRWKAKLSKFLSRGRDERLLPAVERNSSILWIKPLLEMVVSFRAQRSKAQTHTYTKTRWKAFPLHFET